MKISKHKTLEEIRNPSSRVLSMVLLQMDRLFKIYHILK